MSPAGGTLEAFLTLGKATKVAPIPYFLLAVRHYLFHASAVHGRLPSSGGGYYRCFFKFLHVSLMGDIFVSCYGDEVK